jgi:hypothetical protein
MCLLRGIVLGALLVIVGAYIHDSVQTPAASAGAEEATLVNWDVVRSNLKDLATRVHQEWNRLVG